jgi:glycosyltransferase involved in cell wall biosynthesis
MACGSYGGGHTGLNGEFVAGVRRGLVDGIEIVEFELNYSNRDGLLKRTGTFLKFASRSARLALSANYDLVFATSTPLTAGIPGIVARWVRGKHFVFEVRDLWPELPRAMGVIRNPAVLMAMAWLEWLSYHSARKLIGLSPGIVAGITRRGIDGGDVALIPNGCDLGIFASAVASWRPAGVSADDLMAVFAGTHGVANGLDAVLDAARELKRRGERGIKLVLIGDGGLKADLMARAQQESLDAVVFCAPVNKARLAALLSSADLGLQLLANVPAFYYGTSPNKFFDYIAAGLPTLINYPGWLADLVAENSCGIAVAPDNPAAFADALVHAAAHRAELRTMGSRSLELAQSRFSRAKLAGEFVAWLEAAANVAPHVAGDRDAAA